ncbi:MAG: porin family protein [Alphaproteobacteria bacterium]|nr:porin family protein [Alphaproteobacteria bacterium]
MSNRFKTAVLSASALIALPLMTSPAQAGLDANPFDGLYLGFNFNYAKVKANATYSLLDANTSTFNGISSTNSKSGYGGVLYGGIGTNVWGPIYVGIEGGLGLNGGTGSVSDGTASFGLKSGFSFDISGRLGVTLSDNILLYTIGGYTTIKFSSRGFATSQKKGLAGYRYGVGFEVGILEDVAIRVEYVRTKHSSVAWTQGGDSFLFDPSTQVIKVGLVLHMN